MSQTGPLQPEDHLKNVAAGAKQKKDKSLNNYYHEKIYCFNIA
jgi:hypothetical protein